MKIPNLSLNQSGAPILSPLSNQAGRTENPLPSQTSQGSSATLSSLSAFAVSHNITDLSYTDNQTLLGYRQDNSLALQASSTLDFKFHQENTRFDLTLSAKALGLAAKDFADPTQPLTIKLNYTQSDLNYSHEIKVSTSKTIRQPADILTDLTDALREIFSRQGDKTISVFLDDEALGALASDPKIKKLFGELLSLIQVLNSLKNTNQERDQYVIALTGKGKPVTNLQEETQIEARENNIEVNITILPPASTEKAAQEKSLPTPAE
jgi:hypothetical protein